MGTPFILLILSPAAGSVCSFQAHSPLLYFLLLCSDSCTRSHFSTSLTSDSFSSSLASVGICGLHVITTERKPQPPAPFPIHCNKHHRRGRNIGKSLLGTGRHFRRDFSHRPNPERAPACRRAGSGACSSGAVPRQGLRPATFAELRVAPSSPASSPTSGTSRRARGSAALAGEDAGLQQRAAEQSFLVGATAAVRGRREQGLQTPLHCGTPAHEGATVTLEAERSSGIRECFNRSTSFQRETGCQTYLGAVRGVWRKPPPTLLTRPGCSGESAAQHAALEILQLYAVLALVICPTSASVLSGPQYPDLEFYLQMAEQCR